MQKGYVLLNEGGNFRIQNVRISTDESLAFYDKGFFGRREILLGGKCTSSFKGKPFYWSNNMIALNFDGKMPTSEELETKIDLVAKKRFWKYLGQRNLDAFEIIIMLGAGYGLGQLILSIVQLIFKKEGAA